MSGRDCGMNLPPPLPHSFHREEPERGVEGFGGRVMSTKTVAILCTPRGYREEKEPINNRRTNYERSAAIDGLQRAPHLPLGSLAVRTRVCSSFISASLSCSWFAGLTTCNQPYRTPPSPPQTRFLRHPQVDQAVMY